MVEKTGYFFKIFLEKTEKVRDLYHHLFLIMVPRDLPQITFPGNNYVLEIWVQSRMGSNLGENIHKRAGKAEMDRWGS